MSTDIEDAQETTHYVPEGIPPRSTRPSRRHLYQPLTNLAASGGGCPSDPRENVAAQASSTGRLVWTFVVGGVLGAAAAGCFLFSANRQKRARSIVSGIATINACEGKDCTSFDCEKDQGDWVEKWSNSKKLYCCGMTCLEKSIRLKKKMPSGPPAVPKLSVPHSATTTTTTTNTTTIKVTTTSTAETTAATTSKHAVVHPEPKIHAPSLLKGISYCPVPVKATESLKSDDWMTDLAKPLWSASGRGDLHVMHSLGANAVRLYGNNPELDHAHFLDEAHANDLKVIPGMSDFPYYQDPTTSCVATQYNCFSQIKKQYGENLKNGFLTKEKQYHPALRYFILINEPDLKMPRTANSAPGDAALLAKAIVSSFDAVLDAEKDARVVGTVINFTTTFSYAICTACPNNEGLPALGQMLLIEDAMRSPEKYGYRPKHQLYPAYLQRWVNSFNTANSAADLQRTFFTHYGKVFPTTPVFIGEYHKPEGPVLAEVKDILHLTTTMPLFLGISFFEFQVAYWKGGAEMAFGLFGLGGYPIGHFKYADGAKYTSWCLQPQLVGGALLPDALAEAYGGHAPDVSELCLPQPDTVPLSQLGYNLIVGLKDMDKFQRFVARVATHLGLDVVDGNGLKEFAKIYMDGSGPGYQFDNVVKDMQHRMPWLTRSDGARCVADRNASTVAVETAIKWGCAHLSGSSSCDQINAACLTAFEKGDWVFSRYFQSVHDHADPLQQCNFGGAAMYATPSVFSQHAAPQCVLP